MGLVNVFVAQTLDQVRIPNSPDLGKGWGAKTQLLKMAFPPMSSYW